MGKIFNFGETYRQKVHTSK